MRALIVTTLAVFAACGGGSFDAELDWGPGYILPVASLADDPSGTWVICEDATCRTIDSVAFALEPGGHMRTPRASLRNGRLTFCKRDDDLWQWRAFGTQLTFTFDPRAPGIHFRERREPPLHVEMVQDEAVVFWSIRQDDTFENQPVPSSGGVPNVAALSAGAGVFEPRVTERLVRVVRVRSGAVERCQVF
jgi:hypothetical protein